MAATRRRAQRPAPPPVTSTKPAAGADTATPRGTRARLAPGLELLVAAPQQAAAVAFLGDVTAEQLARLDVDRVVLEDVVEEIGLVAGIEPAESELFHLLEIRAVGSGDLHPLGEIGI